MRKVAKRKPGPSIKNKTPILTVLVMAALVVLSFMSGWLIKNHYSSKLIEAFKIFDYEMSTELSDKKLEIEELKEELGELRTEMSKPTATPSIIKVIDPPTVKNEEKIAEIDAEIARLKERQRELYEAGKEYIESGGLGSTMWQTQMFLLESNKQAILELEEERRIYE